MSIESALDDALEAALPQPLMKPLQESAKATTAALVSTDNLVMIDRLCPANVVRRREGGRSGRLSMSSR